MTCVPHPGRRVAVFGEDAISRATAESLTEMGFDVATRDHNGAFVKADIYVFSESGADCDGQPVTEDLLRRMKPGSVLFAREFGPVLRDLARHYGLITEELPGTRPARRTTVAGTSGRPDGDAIYLRFVLDRVPLWSASFRRQAGRRPAHER